jgi:hypothetical protein
MIYFVRSATISQIRVANWINSKHPGGNIQPLRAISGQVFNIYWLASADSLGQMEQILASIESDPEYQHMINESRSGAYSLPAA